MRFLSVLVLLLGFSVPAYAQSAPKIRAIEYPEITRLVLPAPQEAEWTLSRDRTHAMVTFLGSAEVYDASDIPQQIPRTRVLTVETGISPLGTTLDIALGCSCDVTVRRLNNDLVSVDIRRADPAKAAASGVEGGGQGRREELISSDRPAVGGPSADNQPGTDHVSSDGINDHDTEGRVAHGAMSEGDPAMRISGDDMPDDDSEQDARGGPVPYQAVVSRDPELDAAREALLSELGLAARDGLVRLTPTLDPAEGSETGTAHADAESPHLDLALGEAGGSNHEPGHDSPADPTDHLLSSGHGAEDPGHQDPPMMAGGPACPPPGALELGRWPGEDGDFSEALGALRRSLVSPMGETDAHAIERLARFYILNGFGREASQLLHHPLAEGIAGSMALRELSRVVDGAAIPASGALGKAEGCGGAIDLWRAAAGLELPDYRTESGVSVLHQLSELPPSLRRLVAQNLIQNTLIFGKPDDARVILELLERTPGPVDHREAFLRHLIDLEAAEPAGPDRDILKVVASDTELLELYALRTVDANKRPPLWLNAALEDGERVHRDRDTGARLRNLRALVAELDGRHADAFALLREGQSRWPGAADGMARTARVLLARLDADDPDDLGLAMANADQLGAGASSKDLAIRFAAGLANWGLPNAALEMLDRVPNDLASADTRIMSAQILLSAGDPPAAIAALQGLGGADADQIRSLAYRRLRDWSTAASTRPVQSQSDRADQAYLRLLGGGRNEVDRSSLTGDRAALSALIPASVTATQDGEAVALQAETREGYMSGLGTLLGSSSELRGAVAPSRIRD